MTIKNQDNGVLNHIRCNLAELTVKEKKAASYLLRKPEEVADSVISEFANTSGVSEGTIVRLSKKLGYKGFTELKRQLIIHLAEEKEGFTYSDVTSEDSFKDILSKVVQSSIQALTTTKKFMLKEKGEKAVEILSKAAIIQFYGLGEAASAAEGARDKFSRIGLQAQAPTDPDQQLISASLLSENDAAIGISHSGRSEPTIAAIKAAKEAGAQTICITNSPGSPLTEYSDVDLYTAAPPSVSVRDEVAARRITEFAVIEALYLGVLYLDSEERLKRLKHSTNIASKNKI